MPGRGDEFWKIAEYTEPPPVCVSGGGSASFRKFSFFLFNHADYLNFHGSFAGEARDAYRGARGGSGFAQLFAEVFAGEVCDFRVGAEAFARVDVDGRR